MPDDDWALGQNEVDVRNEARNPLNARPVKNTYWNECAYCGTRYDGSNGMKNCTSGMRHMWRLSSEPFVVFACRNPEQAWIDESRSEAEREAKS